MWFFILNSEYLLTVLRILDGDVLDGVSLGELALD